MSSNCFPELISPHLMNLMKEIKNQYGEDSRQYKALYYQYCTTDKELIATKEHNSKHYEAGYDSESSIRFMERLYKRQATVDITLACVAHCRYCLRQNYELGVMTENDMKELADIISKDPYLKEILITGGDPLLARNILIPFMEYLIKLAPNIRIIRIGSRLPVQDPHLMSEELYKFFETHRKDVAFEVAMQINHAVELQPAARESIDRLKDAGVRLYAQNVLLRNVNDNMDSLIELYDELRYLNIESHYIFHPVPIERTHQFRIPLVEFLDFARLCTASGEIPGRSKPMFSLMTDVGKVTLYEGCLGKKDSNGYYDICTGYRLEDRQKWHEGYCLPDSAHIDEKGFIHVKYLDGE